ncbi:MAG: peptidylprolyl isomerase [Candidatus Omnitrophota bacterium]
MPGKTKLFFVNLFVSFFLLAGASHAEVVDKILVVVNDEIITQGEIDRIFTPIYEQYANLYSGQELVGKLDEAWKNVLERLIHDKLLLSEAKRRKVEVDDREVDARMDEVRQRFPNEKEFERTLVMENIVLSDLERKFRERLMMDRLIEMELRKDISVSPNEILLYYEKNKETFREPKKVKLRAILIRVNENRSEEAAIRSAKEILNRIEKGGDFVLLAEKYSEGPYAASGGDMEWVEEGELMGRIDDLVFSLDENEISGILKTNLGYHIFKVEEKKDSRAIEFHEAKKRIEQILYNKKTQEKLKKWIERLKENAYIAFK